MSAFTFWTWASVLCCSALCWALRSRFYGIYRAVILSILALITTALFPHLARSLHGLFGAESDSLFHGPGLLLLYLHVTVFVDALALIRPRSRSRLYRGLISLPAQYFTASTLLAFPWAIFAAFGLTPHGAWIPYLIGVVGLYQSLSLRRELNDVTVGEVELLPHVARLFLSSSSGARKKRAETETSPDALRIIQITDPHLGPFMSVSRLAQICERAHQEAPDLILLTGDFLTMESQSDPDLLRKALAPLAKSRGKVFACLGNHDHEALSHVVTALEKNGVQLLVDSSTIAETRLGPVEVMGFDFHFKDRAERTARVLRAHPRTPGTKRILLLHDPGAFKHLPDRAADLVLSGHTHGGQIGLVSFGLNFTVANWIAKIPDHGLWGNGRNRLYVHRGTGHYGYPLRLGVPAEESVLRVQWV